MIKKTLPLVLLLIGAGAGVGAGIFLRPETSVEEEKPSENVAERAEDTAAGDNEYVKLNNQLVIPIVSGERVTALVVLALSIEVPAGKSEAVFLREPKIRDSFLQVLFDHANIGGFDGNFTDTEALGRLRTALKEVAQKDLGRNIAKDVLIVEIARQDY